MRCAATENNKKIFLKWKLNLAQPEAWVALLMIFSVTLCKISSRRLWLIFKVTKKNPQKPKNKQTIANDACLANQKQACRLSYVYICYIHVSCITKQM